MNNMKNISLIAVVANDRAIGKDNNLLTKVPGDLPRFKRLTTGHTIIMGRKTFDSFGGRPLPNRRHIILTRDENFSCEGVDVVHSVKGALSLLRGDKEVFCIGGGEIYSLFLPYANKMYLTKLNKSFEADTFFPEYNPDNWRVISAENNNSREKCDFDFAFMDYERINK